MSPDQRAAESLLAFWADAGVDVSMEDEPQDRMARGLEAMKPRPIVPPTPIAPVRAKAPTAAPETAGALATAKTLAAAANDLAALEAAIAGFEGCPLRFAGASRAVFARGAADAPLMIIGEGPGADEDAQGAPFVGRAGKLLDKMLAASGLTDRVFITNTVFWRPPGNRDPTPAEQLVCLPFLERAIALIQPKILLLAGGAAAKSVLRRKEGILAMRGRWFEWKSTDGAMELPALPTLHPAFLLRQPAAKKMAWDDLLTLVERLDRAARPT